MAKHILLWAASGLIAAIFVLDGAFKLISPQSDQAMFARYGFGLGFVIVLGIIEVAAGLALLPSRLAPWGAGALAALLLVGALLFATHREIRLAIVHVCLAALVGALGMARRRGSATA